MKTLDKILIESFVFAASIDLFSNWIINKENQKIADVSANIIMAASLTGLVYRKNSDYFQEEIKNKNITKSSPFYHNS
jgi:hypothetical protein